jgi:4-amino-4-deoxy-L-arabinose transferase-like glycosyltransferase
LKKIKTPITRIIEKVISGRQTFDRVNLKKLLSENYPLLSILIGFTLVALSIGPYQNGDTAWEYDAVSGVMKYGLPYANGFQLMDQPPLGFYIQAVFFKAVGSSISNGTFSVTLFGLGCITLVYAIGKVMYNKTTGYFAALLFAFSPWHLILSRTFLIDAQCLFFSLFSLFVGINAIRKNSFKLFIVSGIIFAAAFNTKLYSVFVLIPILVYFFYFGKKNLKHTTGWLAAFSLPVLLGSYLWYQTIIGVGMGSIFFHTDLIIHDPSSIAPSYFFVGNFLISYGLGWFLVDAAIVSLLVCLMQRRLFKKFFVFDTICLAVIACVIGVNTFLGAGLDLKAPYLNAIKYDYQSLPFFCLLAGSLVSKSFSLVYFSKTRRKLGKLTFSLTAVIGLVLVVASILYNMGYVNLFSTWNYLIFRVEPGINEGYSLFNYTPIGEVSLLMGIQYFGFVIMLSGLLYASKHKIIRLLKFGKN